MLQTDWSVAGLVGFDAPDDKGAVVVNEDLRVTCGGTSFNHDVRRPGLGIETDEVGTCGAVCCECSPSSSDDARAISESGVERRTPGCAFSRRVAAVEDEVGEVLCFGACPALLDWAAIVLFFFLLLFSKVGYQIGTCESR